MGKILNPVVGWTSHHSVCKVDGKTYLFYHDSSLSKGVTHLRCIKLKLNTVQMEQLLQLILIKNRI